MHVSILNIQCMRKIFHNEQAIVQNAGIYIYIYIYMIVIELI